MSVPGKQARYYVNKDLLQSLLNGTGEEVGIWEQLTR